MRDYNQRQLPNLKHYVNQLFSGKVQQKELDAIPLKREMREVSYAFILILSSFQNAVEANRVQKARHGHSDWRKQKSMFGAAVVTGICWKGTRERMFRRETTEIFTGFHRLWAKHDFVQDKILQGLEQNSYWVTVSWIIILDIIWC